MTRRKSTKRTFKASIAINGATTVFHPDLPPGVIGTVVITLKVPPGHDSMVEMAAMDQAKEYAATLIDIKVEELK